MPHIKPFFHPDTSTFCYVVHDPKTLDAVVIDPVLDYYEASATLSHDFLDQILEHVRAHQLVVQLIIDTHCHADHFSGTHALKKLLKVKSAIGHGFKVVRDHFASVYDMTHELNRYEEPYDILVNHQQIFHAGALSIKAFCVAGHTPSCMAYLIDDALFCGDALFMPELGCGRCDFPGGSAGDLYDAITKNIYTLPNDTKILVGHDYPATGTKPRYETSVRESKNSNILMNINTLKKDFVTAREKKDKTLQYPKLLLAAMQVNILGGQLPLPAPNHQRYLKIPLSLRE